MYSFDKDLIKKTIKNQENLNQGSYSINTLIIQNLIEEGWKLIANNEGIVTEARKERYGNVMCFKTEQEFKNWMMQKAIEYSR